MRLRLMLGLWLPGCLGKSAPLKVPAGMAAPRGMNQPALLHHGQALAHSAKGRASCFERLRSSPQLMQMPVQADRSMQQVTACFSDAQDS